MSQMRRLRAPALASVGACVDRRSSAQTAGTVPRNDWLFCAVLCVQLDWAGAALAALLVARRDARRAADLAWRTQAACDGIVKGGDELPKMKVFRPPSLRCVATLCV